jgi:hypothetical protein
MQHACLCVMRGVRLMRSLQTGMAQIQSEVYHLWMLVPTLHH